MLSYNNILLLYIANLPNCSLKSETNNQAGMNGLIDARQGDILIYISTILRDCYSYFLTFT